MQLKLESNHWTKTKFYFQPYESVRYGNVFYVVWYGTETLLIGA